jgi:hypothetical protein
MTRSVFVERSFESPLHADDVYQLAAGAGWCMDMYRVQWRASYLASDGRSMLCHFEAPDAESVRMGLRQAAAEPGRAWPGTVHTAAAEGEPNVVVVREFDAPACIDELQAIEDAGAACLDMHRVSFIRTFFAADRKRMLCLYRARDAESVRIAQRQANMPLESVWSCQFLPAGE